MTVFRRTLTTTSDLADAGLISDARAAEIAMVGTRYAVAVTPAMAELIDRSDAADPIAWGGWPGVPSRQLLSGRFSG